MTWQILEGDALAVLRSLPSDSVDCVVTSPPYWALRDYGVDGQMGLEASPEAFVAALVEVFREVRRVLKPSGTCWVNLGDCYCTRPSGPSLAKSTLQGSMDSHAQVRRAKSADSFRRDKAAVGSEKHRAVPGLKNKDLVGIPWRVAFALQADGWWLRRDIIWDKPNAMPESAKDRPTTSHEYVFLLSKSERYFYDWEAIQEPVSGSAHPRSAAAASFPGRSDRDPNRRRPGVNPKALKMPSGWDTGKGAHGSIHRDGRARVKQNASFSAAISGLVELRNKRSVWTIPCQPFPEAHFATYPMRLVEPCILAGCPAGGVVLDPFVGSGTTGCVALQLNRDFIGIELSPEYAEMARRRIGEYDPMTLPLFRDLA